MPSYIRFTRCPYEEPYNLHLILAACNGRQAAEIEFYVGRQILSQWAEALEAFPRRRNDTYLWEYGSERPKDKWAYYLRLCVFTTDAAGHCAIQLRLNNNAPLPEREISEFCIKAEAAAVNRLGSLFSSFANLEHEVLVWTPTAGRLIKTRKEAEPDATPNGGPVMLSGSLETVEGPPSVS